MKQNIDEAAEMGARRVAFLSGRDPGDADRPRALEALIKSTREMCAYARDKGLALTCETFDRDVDKKCLIGPSPYAAEYAKAVRQDYPDFGLMYDLSHRPQLFEEAQSALAAVASYLVHIHIGNAVVEQGKPGYGDLHPRFGWPASANDVPEVLDFVRALFKVGYLKEGEARPQSPITLLTRCTMNRPAHFHGPLRVHPTNPRYFTDASGKAIYLTGSHTWANLQDIGLPGGPPFPHAEYLDFMQSHGHNFMRFWMFEHPERASWTDAHIVFDPLPWARTAPGLAADGKPKFDLDAWNEAYFARMRERIIAAGERGIYCAVMLFQGWSLHKTSSRTGDPWPVHPFNTANNVNGVDVPYTGADDDVHPCLHSTLNPAALARQEAYVRKVIDTVNDLDNVLYEIINEGGATAWQIHMINLIHEVERTKPRQHPVGMTHRISPKQFNAELFASPAEWISPAKEPQDWMYPGTTYLEDYQNDPPVADGRKVVLNDTDHLWGHGGNPKWVWKSFLRGHNPIFMDPWWPLYIESDPAVTPWTFVGGISKDWRDYPDWEPTRRAMGDTRRYAQKMDLAAMTPRPELASTRYCLANPGQEYLVYLPEGGSVTLNLCGRPGSFAVEWFLPQVNRTFPGARPLPGGDYAVTVAPYTGDAVLYLKRIG